MLARRQGATTALSRSSNSPESKVAIMGTFYTDEQIQEAIAALESYLPGIWESMKKIAPITDTLSEEQEKEKSAIVRALTVVLPKVSFVAQAENKFEAENLLILDVRNAVQAAIDSARHYGITVTVHSID
jgi:hypothetical protein